MLKKAPPIAIRHETMRIAGRKVDLTERIPVRYPFTGEVVGSVPAGRAEHAAEAFAIARAYAIEPVILFADEPTGNLDSKTGAQITELLFELRDRTGASLVLVTHEDRLARRGDRVIRLAQGRIRE